MNQSPTARISLFLIAALAAGLLPPPLHAEARRAQTMQVAFDGDLARPVKCQAAATPTTPTSAKPTKASTKPTPPAPGKQLAGTTCSYATRLTVPGPSRSALNAPLQFLYASFTSTPAPQESRRPAVGVPVKFTLSNPALGTLNTSEVETNAEGIAEVQFTANTDHQRGFLLATAGSAEKKIPLEVVRPAPTKVLLIAGLLTLIAVVVTVVVTKKGDIKPLPPPVIP